MSGRHTTRGAAPDVGPGDGAPVVARARRAALFGVRALRRSLATLVTLTYLVATRGLVFVLGLYLVLYFLAGTSTFKDIVQELVSSTVPGTMTAATVQWGPNPFMVRIADGRVFGADGEEIIRVEAVVARVDLGATIPGLLAFIDAPDDAKLIIHFDHVALGRPNAYVDVDAAGEVNVYHAFVSPEPSQPGSRLPDMDLRAKVVQVVEAGGWVQTPELRVDVSGLNAVTDYALLGREPHMRFRVQRADVARADGWFSASLRAPDAFGRYPIEARDIAVEGFTWDGLTFTWARATGTAETARFETTGGMDIAPTPVAWHGRVDADVPRDSPALYALFGDLLGAPPEAGEMSGLPIRVSVAGSGTTEQARAMLAAESDALTLLGVPFTDVSLEVVTVPIGTPDNPQAHALSIRRFRGRAAGGEVSAANGYYGPAPGGSAPGASELAASVEVVGVSAPAAADALFGPLHPDVLAAMAGRLHGRVELSATFAPLDAGVDLQIHLPQMVYDWDGADAVPLAGSYNLAGAVVYRERPFALGPDGEIAPIRTLDLQRIAIDDATNRVRLEGRLDLARQTFNLTPYVRFGEAREPSRRLGLPPLHGRLVFKDSRLTGPFDDPRIRTTLSWSNARLDGQELGRIVAGLTLRDGVLDVRSAYSRTPFGAFEAAGHVRLFSTDPGVAGVAMPFEITRLTASDVDVTQLMGRTMGQAARLDVTDTTLSGDLRDITGTLTGTGRASLRNVVIGGETVRRVSARLRADAQAIVVDDAAATLGSGDVVSGSFTVARRSGKLHGVLRARSVPLESLRSVRTAAPDLRGDVSADLTLSGTLDRPGLIGRVALDGVAVGDVRLGAAELDLLTLPDGRVDVSSTRFFPGFELLDGSGVDLDGVALRHLHVGVRARDASLGDLLPQLAQAGVYVRTGARVELDVWPGQTPAHDLRAEAAPGEVVVGLREHGVHYLNTTPLRLAHRGHGFELEPVTFAPRRAGARRAPTSEGMALCGSLSAGGQLDLRLAGVLDLAFLENLGDAFSVLEGHLRVASDPDAAAARDDERCPMGAGDAVLQVSGPLSAPVATGRLVTAGVTAIPRGLGHQIRLADGGGVILQPGPAPGEQRVLSTEELGLAGELDDGGFVILGAATLRDLRLREADLHITTTDVTHVTPGTFAITFNSSARLIARSLDAEQPKLSLSGSMVITEGRFMKSFDAFARALGGVVGGQISGYSRPLAQQAPWLAQMALDVDVVSRDFRIESAFPLGKVSLDARLDLSVSGTVEDPRVHRRIDLLPGGNLTYSVLQRDFQIASGWLDFDGSPDHPFVDVTARTDVTYIARASTETQDEDEKEVAISLRLSGRVPNIEIEMTSDDPTLDQADIQSLILTGKPRRDLDRSEGVSLVTYDLADVFNDVLKAPFVRTVSVGLGAQGDVRTRIGTCFGPNLCFGGTAVQETTETRLRAGFTLELGDDVTCAGTLRRRDATTTAASTDESYEARCRYRIPLD